MMYNEKHTLKLELESCAHVIAVVRNKPISRNFSQDEKDEEVSYYEEIYSKMLNRMVELTILAGDEDADSNR